MAIPEFLQGYPVFGGGRYGIMSGENPMFKTGIVNPTHEKLVRALKDMHLDYDETHGRYGSPERSVIIHNPTRDHMAQLGKMFGQESVVFGQGHRHELLYTNGEHEGKSRLTDPSREPISHFTSPPDDYYSAVPRIPKGGYFRINFDFNSEPQFQGPVQVNTLSKAHGRYRQIKGTGFVSDDPTYNNHQILDTALREQGFKDSPLKDLGVGWRSNAYLNVDTIKQSGGLGWAGIENGDSGANYSRDRQDKVPMSREESGPRGQQHFKGILPRPDETTRHPSFGVDDWKSVGEDLPENPTLGVSAPNRNAMSKKTLAALRRRAKKAFFEKGELDWEKPKDVEVAHTKDGVYMTSTVNGKTKLEHHWGGHSETIASTPKPEDAKERAKEHLNKRSKTSLEKAWSRDEIDADPKKQQ